MGKYKIYAGLLNKTITPEIIEEESKEDAEFYAKELAVSYYESSSKMKQWEDFLLDAEKIIDENSEHYEDDLEEFANHRYNEEVDKNIIFYVEECII